MERYIVNRLSGHELSLLTPCHEIEPRLWLGNSKASTDIDEYSKYSFTHIVNTALELSGSEPYKECFGVTCV